ncbi:MAG: hypothetical protein EBR82_58855 [Caulobacteraceae bacterium]|nr:hypothetical protein [Caulobacteraceae bacterium]
MGILPILALSCVVLALLSYQFRAFLRQIEALHAEIEAARTREQKLIDKLLTKAGFSPLLERENVVKLPDPEIKQPDFIEEAFRLDAIMEEVEFINPEMRGRNADYVQQLYPDLWRQAEERYTGIHAPLKT